MDRFIYVFTKESFEKLSSCGYVLLKADEKNYIYVFENKCDEKFSMTGVEFVLSNTLTF